MILPVCECGDFLKDIEIDEVFDDRIYLSGICLTCERQTLINAKVESVETVFSREEE